MMASITPKRSDHYFAVQQEARLAYVGMTRAKFA